MAAGFGLRAADKDELALILKKLDTLQQQVSAQQATIRRQDQTISELRSEMATIGQKASAAATTQTNVAQAEVVNAVGGGLAAQSSAPVIALGPNIDRLKFTGDLLLRFEQRNREDEMPGTGDKHEMKRWRTRLRLGAIWTNTAENWEIGVGLATGSYKNKSGSAIGTSANDTWNEDNVFESGDFGLDYAYARHHWEDLTFTVGQQKNPFKTTYILFDSDLRPTGATLQGNHDICATNVFATLGAYNLRYTGEDQDLASMVALQIGAKRAFGEKSSGLLALALYSYNGATSQQYFTTTLNDEYSWDLLDAYGEFGTKVGPVKLTAYGEYVVNLGANSQDGSQFLPTQSPGTYLAYYDPEDNDTAWVAGIKAKYKRLSLNYSYAHIEGDSVPAFQTDGTFANGLSDTNVAGHVVKLKYSVTENFYVGANLFMTKWIHNLGNLDDDTGHNYKNSNIFHVDLGYKF
jgi:hypothetical protein